MVNLKDKDFMNNVYDVLVQYGGAREEERDDFIYHHCTNEYGCDEWRFRGYFGFGGKYRSSPNIVTYYSEDETEELKRLKNFIDNKLKEQIK